MKKLSANITHQTQSNEPDFKTQKQIYEVLRKNDVGANLHYIPVHKHPYYENLGFKENDFPIAEKFHKEVISIPIYPTLQISDQNKVIEILKNELGYPQL